MLKGIIFDFMRTLYDPEKGELFAGVLPMLEAFKEKGLKRGLVSFGGPEKKRLIKELGLTEVLDWYRVVEEKTPEVFRSFMIQYRLSAEHVLVVGDLINQEIAVGQGIGARTVWLKWGLFADERPSVKPDFIINSITELVPVVNDLIQK